jgi:hypothetical protein
MSTMARPSFKLLFAMECCHWRHSRLPNPAVRGGMATPVGTTGSKVRFVGYPEPTRAKNGLFSGDSQK